MPTQAEIDALNDAIVDNAQQPNRVRFGNREVQQQSLADQMAVADRAAQQGITSVNQLFGNRTRLIAGPRQ